MPGVFGLSCSAYALFLSGKPMWNTNSETRESTDSKRYTSLNPLVSAVIPTRNRSLLIQRAVRSACNQTYTNMEVIVVVDGPDAETVKSLESLQEPRLRIIELEENVRGSEARNIGIGAAKGEYIALLDDDDEWLPGKIEKQLAALLRDGSTDCLVSCRHYLKTSDHRCTVAPLRDLHEGEAPSEYLFYRHGFRRSLATPATSSYFAAKSLFMATPFSRGLICHQDWDWFLRVMTNKKTKFVLVDEPLAVFDWSHGLHHISRGIRWSDSLAWLESNSALFTPRAYSAFMLNQCMSRFSRTQITTSTYLRLMKKCWAFGYLDAYQIALSIKWYCLSPFSPRVRAFVKGLRARCLAPFKKR